MKKKLVLFVIVQVLQQIITLEKILAKTSDLICMGRYIFLKFYLNLKVVLNLFRIESTLMELPRIQVCFYW